MSFENGTYRKYDKKTWDLLEETFISEGELMMTKLVSKKPTVLEKYKELIRATNSMKKVDDLEEVESD